MFHALDNLRLLLIKGFIELAMLLSANLYLYNCLSYEKVHKKRHYFAQSFSQTFALYKIKSHL